MAEEATPGMMAVNILVMAAMAGSLGMLMLWWQRQSQGVCILPMAARKPMRVPLPLMVGGIAFSSLMALAVLVASMVPESVLNAAAETQQPATEAETPDANTTDTESSPDTTKEEKVAELKAKLNSKMWQMLGINFLMFVVFGASVLVAQFGHSRRITQHGKVSYPSAWGSTEKVPEIRATHEYSHLETLFQADEPETGPAEPWELMTELRFAAETCLAAYLPTTLLRLASVALLPKAPSHPFLEMMKDGVEWDIMALIALMAVIVAPLVEELLYRVTILGGIWQHHALPVAWTVSTLLFSFAHGFPDSIALMPLAFAIGYAYIRRRSYRTVVLVHFLFNAFNMVVAGVSML